MKFDIHNRFSGKVQFTAEIDCKESEDTSVKIGLSVKWAVKSGANLGGAYLGGANLDGANLARANLGGANLDGANLARAYLDGAYLGGANLDGAYLGGANLARANLARANLARANLGGANLARAYLNGAYLGGANLDGANLGGKKLIGERPIIQIGPIGSRRSYVVGYIREDELIIKAGCFTGTVSEFLEKLENTHGGNIHSEEYKLAIEFIKTHDRLWRKACEQ